MENLLNISYFEPANAYRIELDNGEVHFVPNDPENQTYIRFQGYINQPNIPEYIPLTITPIDSIKNNNLYTYTQKLLEIIKYQKDLPKYVNIIDDAVTHRIQLTDKFMQLNLAKMQEVDKCITNATVFNEFNYRNPDIVYTVSAALNNLNYFQSILKKVEYSLFSPNYQKFSDLLTEYKNTQLTQEQFDLILQEENNFEDTFISEVNFDYSVDTI